MRIWIYGASPEQIQGIIETDVHPGDTIAGASVCAEEGSSFPYSGLTPAISAAIRGKIDVLLVPSIALLGREENPEPMKALFQSYGIAVRSVSSCGSSNS